MVLYDLTRKTKLPRVSFESSALHRIKDEVTFASSALKNQKTSEPDSCKCGHLGDFFPGEEKFDFNVNSSFKCKSWVQVLTLAFFLTHKMVSQDH